MLPHVTEINKLARAHFCLIKVQLDKGYAKSKFIEEYIAGLSIDTFSMSDEQKLAKAYRNTIKPLISHAKKRGFETWQRRQRELFFG